MAVVRIKKETAWRIERIRQVLQRNPDAPAKEIAAETRIAVHTVQGILARYPDKTGYKSRREQKEKEIARREALIEPIVRKNPGMQGAEIARMTGLEPYMVTPLLHRHPEWGWISPSKLKRLPLDAEKTRLPGNHPPRRRIPATRVEREFWEIQQAAEREGFAASDYGLFMVSINYNWARYKADKEFARRMAEKGGMTSGN